MIKGPTLWDQRVPMRDGVELSADVFLPAEGKDGGPYPALVERNCYNNQLTQDGFSVFTKYGYAVVFVDVRGRNDSDGDFYPLHQEPDDGYDTIEWVAQQPWCTGKVGTIGGSYMGWTQMATALRRPPHLDAMWVAVPAGAFGRQEIWNNGIMLLITLGWHNLTGGRSMQHTDRVDWRSVFWHLPLETMDVEALGRKLPAWKDWTQHPGIDDYWKQILFTDEDFARVDIPCVQAGGWYDYNHVATLYFFEGLHKHSPVPQHQHLLIGPWQHGTVGAARSYAGIDFGDDAIVDTHSMMVRWFDHWLKGEGPGLDDMPPARAFLTGRNVWLDLDTWPPPSAPKRLYLRSEGAVTFDPPATDEPDDVYTYDPADPVITLPGDWNAYPSGPTGVRPYPLSDEDVAELRAIDERQDVLIYTSEPLTQALTVAGDPYAVLHASSDGPDTDWFLFLEDVYPDGNVLPLTTGQLRARFRESLEYEKLLVPGEIYEFRIELQAIAHEFGLGHRVRVRITSSQFPRYDRNLNTGEPIGTGTTMRVATNRIVHTPSHPTHLELPLLQDI